MKRNLTIAIARVLIAGTAIAGLGLAAEASAEPLLPQDEFPCQEDEVLGYAPEFGPHHVGCIHIDALREE
ncbi:hypothetical protein KIP29_gp13 [Mycobacterium phage BabyRay]|uniref:Uncharacterized protein n=1 Tax=Mycobacterium phage BabyRay TaxID=1897486 RepID=A0A1D8EW41_9CAUD|nr:hypothetical protein KIP29_gp13 [Mycobacterium phage BabyRay]AOT25451.1 hypothetical protein SEA_BABYRAY_87 [Mycobacterium phage BabyRay]